MEKIRTWYEGNMDKVWRRYGQDIEEKQPTLTQ